VGKCQLPIGGPYSGNKSIGMLALGCLLIVSLSIPVRADDVSGTINGFVHGYGGAPEQNAVVEAYLDVGVKDRFRFAPVARRVTNRFGFFTFLGLVTGRYVIVAQKEGYGPECALGVVVLPNGLGRVNLYMSTRGGMIRDTCMRLGPPEEMIYF
jgi:hypothetical protein